ncbi:MAG TPA: FkbM family methyltransferase [Solirubrobacterales bacterium]|nr:FkbM family methyltransferase [Solirubrobacterales bacterium]
MSGRLHPHLRLARVRAHKLARLARDRSYWPALRRGVAAAVEHADIPFDPATKTVLDVGASRGQFALFATRRFPGTAIVSFEPLPDACAVLEEVTAHRVDARRTAIGATRGEADINVSSSDDSSSLLPIGARQVSEFPGTETDHTIVVPVSTLDDEIPTEPERPCLLKLDVQGLELDVLKGATRTLDWVDEALIECSFVELYEGQALADEIVTFMHEAGLGLAGVHEVTYSADGSAIQADFFFKRRKR